MKVLRAADLRIGNFLYSEDDSVFTVKGIHDGEYFDVGYRKLLKYSQFKPIPLSEEWLLKLHFSKEDDSNFPEFEFHGFKLLHFADSEEKFFEFFNHDFPTKLRYVHQLQNLYYALTGNELSLEKEEDDEDIEGLKEKK